MGQTTRRIGKGISWAFKIFMLIAVFISIMSVLNYTGVLSGQNQTVNNIWDQAVSFFSGGIDATKQLVKTGVNKTSEQLEGLPQIETPNITLPVLSETDNTENNKITQTNRQGIPSFTGTVAKITDGDTLHVGQTKVRLTLVDTPEKEEKEPWRVATLHTKSVCPVGSTATVYVDVGQVNYKGERGKDRYNRTLGVVYCGDINLNANLLENGHADIRTEYCSESTFKDEFC